MTPTFLLLLVGVPPTPSSLRVRVWRRLRSLGAVALKRSAYLLPDNPERYEDFQWLAQEIQRDGGDATLVRVQQIDNISPAEVLQLFHAPRDEDYKHLAARYRKLLQSLDRKTASTSTRTHEELARLAKEHQRVRAIDYFGAPGGAEVRRLEEAIAMRTRRPESARPAPAAPRRSHRVGVADQALHRSRGRVRLRAAGRVSQGRDRIRRAGRGAEPSRPGLHVRDTREARAPPRPPSGAAGRGRPRSGPARRQVPARGGARHRRRHPRAARRVARRSPGARPGHGDVRGPVRHHGEEMSVSRPTTIELLKYFLYLGSLGFGGPVALVGYMQRDLVERRQWFTKEEYMKSLALSQLAPGPLAAQLAICLGYVHSRVAGATLVSLAFILPSFIMTVAISWLYVRFGGLSWMQAAFYGVGATVIGIITIAAYKLAKLTMAKDRLQWVIFALMAMVTAWTETEILWLFLLCGLAAMVVQAPPAWLKRSAPACFVVVATPEVLGQILWFFAKAGAFVFGSGLAIVPFLYGGVVQEYGWLNDKQFLDAVAVAMLTPGPIVITVAFIGYLVAAFPGALAAAIGVFLPVYLFVVIPFPWFDRIIANAKVKGFVVGVTAAASGTIAGACFVLARRAIVDVPTLVIGLAALLLAWRFKIPEPVLIAAGAAAGLLVFSLR